MDGRTSPAASWNPFGRTFQNKTRLYVSPWLNRKSGNSSRRAPSAPRNNTCTCTSTSWRMAVVDVPFFNEFLLRHTPRDIQRMIAADEDIWKTLVPAEAHRSALHFRDLLFKVCAATLQCFSNGGLPATCRGGFTGRKSFPLRMPWDWAETANMRLTNTSIVLSPRPAAPDVRASVLIAASAGATGI